LQYIRKEETLTFLRFIVRWIDFINEKIGNGASWLALGMVLITIWDVTLRYIFRAGSVTIQELEWHFFGINFLIAAGLTFKNDGHVRVDIFYDKMDQKKQAILNFGGNILFLIPYCALVVWMSYPFVANSWSLGECSPDPGGLPCRYLMKAVLPAGFFLLLFQAISEAIKNLFILLGDKGQT